MTIWKLIMLTFENLIIAFGFFVLCYGLYAISNIMVSGSVFVTGILIVIWQHRKPKKKPNDELMRKYEDKI